MICNKSEEEILQYLAYVTYLKEIEHDFDNDNYTNNMISLIFSLKCSVSCEYVLNNIAVNDMFVSLKDFHDKKMLSDDEYLQQLNYLLESLQLNKKCAVYNYIERLCKLLANASIKPDKTIEDVYLSIVLKNRLINRQKKEEIMQKKIIKKVEKILEIYDKKDYSITIKSEIERICLENSKI